MSIGLIIFLIILGIILFIIEFMLIPGVTVAGIAGAVCILSGVILSFHFHGATVGMSVLLGTTILTGLSVYLMLRAGTWKKLMLTTAIDGKIENVTPGDDSVKEGDTGVTITRLNPSGKVKINGKYFEARSLDKLIDQKVKIEVVRVDFNTIIVTQVN